VSGDNRMSTIRVFGRILMSHLHSDLSTLQSCHLSRKVPQDPAGGGNISPPERHPTGAAQRKYRSGTRSGRQPARWVSTCNVKPKPPALSGITAARWLCGPIGGRIRAHVTVKRARAQIATIERIAGRPAGTVPPSDPRHGFIPFNCRQRPDLAMLDLVGSYEQAVISPQGRPNGVCRNAGSSAQCKSSHVEVKHAKA